VYEGVKTDKYSDQPNFVPFIVETGGRVGVAGRRQAGERGGGGACAGRRRWGCPGTVQHGRTQH
jgi:hypothetical protein